MTSALQVYLKSKGEVVVAVALSAIAVQLLDDGQTVYSAFQISIPTDQDSTCNIFPTISLIMNFD